MNETVIGVEGLSKSFRIRTQGTGGRGNGETADGPVGNRRVGRGRRRKIIETVDAVKEIDFSVERGDILAFIGPNGAGKSTTIKLITGILYPDTGRVSVLGMDPHKERRRLAYRIGTVFGQKSQLWYHLPPLDSFRLLAGIYDVPTRKAEERIEELNATFELDEYLNRPVRKLSLGQRIRCEIAASLIHEPEILFLDEPSIGLDVVVKQRIRDLILDVNRRLGTTIFLTSHDAGDIEKICRRAIVINHGRIAWEGTINEMKYSLLRKRIISVKTDGVVDLDLPGVTVLKQKAYSAKLEVDTDTISLETVIQELMRGRSIQDIAISGTPMEEVIAMIYGRGV